MKATLNDYCKNIKQNETLFLVIWVLRNKIRKRMSKIVQKQYTKEIKRRIRWECDLNKYLLLIHSIFLIDQCKSNLDTKLIWIVSILSSSSAKSSSLLNRLKSNLFFLQSSLRSHCTKVSKVQSWFSSFQQNISKFKIIKKIESSGFHEIGSISNNEGWLE